MGRRWACHCSAEILFIVKANSEDEALDAVEQLPFRLEDADERGCTCCPILEELDGCLDECEGYDDEVEKEACKEECYDAHRGGWECG